MGERLQIFTGNANPSLAEEIARHLGIPLGQATVSTFSDGEVRVRIEENVRGSDVFVVQPTCAPVDHHLMELLIMIDALRRASAHRITAVIPYYGYARQERKTAGREPISARLVANLITTAGADRVLTVDLHAPAIEGFFDIPVDHLRAGPILADYFQKLSLPAPVVVAPDEGGVDRAVKFRDRLRVPLAIIAKHRPQPEAAKILEMVGDVAGRTAIIVDDIISTGATLIEAVDSLLQRGARAVYAAAVHPVFSANAVERIRASALEKVVVTNTIPVPAEERGEKIEVLSVAHLLAQAIQRIHEHRSVSELFR
ncbi:MAG: ribose-phosphate diphosphokinase [Anaerolineae bacterium]